VEGEVEGMKFTCRNCVGAGELGLNAKIITCPNCEGSGFVMVIGIMQGATCATTGKQLGMPLDEWDVMDICIKAGYPMIPYKETKTK
jgi:hypothetical protein